MKTFIVITVSVVMGLAVFGAVLEAEEYAGMTPAQISAAKYQRYLEGRADEIRQARQERNDLEYLMLRQDLQRRAKQ